MKRLILFLILAVGFVLASCDNEEPKVFRLDPKAMISIKPEQKAWNGSMRIKADGYLSPLDIVRQTTVIRFKNTAMYGTGDATRGFELFQRDTISAIPSLKMWGTDIISSEGEYVPEFIEGHDCILEHWHTNSYFYGKKDTIAYIPNSVLRAAETAIKQAFADKNTELVYQLFNEAFTFRPTTGAEYRQLKLLNQN